MQYYNVNDVMKMTGTKQQKSYDIIKELNKKYKKKFPDAEVIQGKVLKWFYDEAMGIKKDCQEQT